ncbi:hypothetical protein LZ31DRAFT_592609 [Colletotrichum somersetense]|nr:hypothetical protein LZ31DRAFT_592609 [Colletotrichum somersetense]
MKSTSLLIAAATFMMGVQAEATNCSSEANATLCYCANEDASSTRNVCLFEFAGLTPINDTDGVTKCQAGPDRKLSQCIFASSCASLKAVCS